MDLLRFAGRLGPTFGIRQPVTEPHTPVMPSEAPLDMPVQSLTEGALSSALIPTSPRHMIWRRLFIFGLSLLIGATGIGVLAASLSYQGFHPLEMVFLGLAGFLFTWMAFAFISSLAGVWVYLTRQDDLGLFPDGPIPLLRQQTAILMPICNEDAHAVVGRLDTIRQSLIATLQGNRFDIFVLSDTQDPVAAETERTAFLKMQRLSGAPRIYYRRRPINTDRKAGNIADWVSRHGGAYAHMIVLDADSLMSGNTLVRLAGGMERHPRVGLIQTAPRLINRKSLFARCEQFAARLYGPVAACGIAWWSGSEGNFWGHNAIIRTRAFAEAAGLPHLPGRAPFGGHIMSHDFVEAALLRRAGWAVHMAPHLDGSYEESPPSLMDTLGRDRRWCQGNLQHAAVVGASGLHGINRFHLLRGVFNYLLAPMWVGMVATGAALAAADITPVAASVGPLAGLFAVTMAFLIVPKVLAAIVVLRDPDTRSGFGGGVRATLSLIVETVLSTLIAPVVMISHAFMVASILSGRKSGWKSQRRSEYEVSADELARRFTAHTLIGMGLLLVASIFAPETLLMTAGAAFALMLSVPVAYLTAKATPRRLMPVFLIPEEGRVTTESGNPMDSPLTPATQLP